MSNEFWGEMPEFQTRQQWDVEIRRCRDDFYHFLTTWWTYKYAPKGKRAEIRRYVLLPHSKEAIDIYENYNKIIWLKARQIYASTTIGAYIYWKAAFHYFADIQVVSADEARAKRFLNRIKFGHQMLPDWLTPPLFSDTTTEMGFGIERKNADTNQKEIYGQNSYIRSVPTTQKAGRSDTLTDLIVDEADIIDSAVFLGLINAAEPSLELNNGTLCCLSTGKQAGGSFQALWDANYRKKGQYYALFTPFDVLPHRNMEWREEKFDGFRDDFIRQEYPKVPEEAFIAPGRSVFNKQKLYKLLESVKSGQTGNLLGDAFLEDKQGFLEIWQKPQENTSYVIGADVAQGGENGDYSAAQVIDRKTGEQVARWHGHMEEFEFARILFDLANYYNEAYLCVEANPPGNAVVNYLYNELMYSNMQMRQEDDKPGGLQDVERVGWLTTKRTRPLIISWLVEAFSEDSIVLTDARTIGEMLNFVRNKVGKPEALVGKHDDLVMSLAIAWQGVQTCPLMIEPPERRRDMVPGDRYIMEMMEDMEGPEEIRGVGGGAIAWYEHDYQEEVAA